MEAWDGMLAQGNVVAEHRPHDDEACRVYLQWYQVRTRTRVTYVPPELPQEPADASAGYPVRRDQNYGTAVSL